MQFPAFGGELHRIINKSISQKILKSNVIFVDFATNRQLVFVQYFLEQYTVCRRHISLVEGEYHIVSAIYHFNQLF